MSEPNPPLPPWPGAVWDGQRWVTPPKPPSRTPFSDTPDGCALGCLVVVVVVFAAFVALAVFR